MLGKQVEEDLLILASRARRSWLARSDGG